MKIPLVLDLRAFSVFLLFCGICVSQETLDPTAQRARDILLAGVADKNPNDRIQAVFAASLIGAHEKVISKLATMLDEDKDVPVRIAIVSSLGDFKDPTVVPILEKALKDPAPEVDFAAAKALFQLKQPSGKEVLLSVLSGQAKASSSFLTSQKRGALRMLHTPSKLFMTAASVAVPVPGFGVGLTSAQGILSDSGASARAAVLLLLQNDQDAATKEAIHNALSDKEWSVRAAAVHAIAMRNDPALKQEFVPLFDDKKDAVQFRAAAGYIRLALLQKP
jgi:HEAT repeat protein